MRRGTASARRWRSALLAALAGLAPAAAAGAEGGVPPPAIPAVPTLEAEVGGVLARAPAGTRFGLLVLDEAGREVFALDPDRRFVQIGRASCRERV